MTDSEMPAARAIVTAPSTKRSEPSTKPPAPAATVPSASPVPAGVQPRSASAPGVWSRLTAATSFR